jgi:protein ImuB
MPRDAAAPARVLALHLPDLPLQRLRRGREGGVSGHRPVAVLEEGRVVCCDRAARAAGVRPGETAAEALAACGRLEAVIRDPAGDLAALRALAEVLLGLAPAVEVASPDVLLLDASAARLLAPADSGHAGNGRVGEDALVERALQAVSEMGYAACAAVASGRGPARALARHGGLAAGGHGDAIWISPDETARALATLPLAALGLAPAVAARLASVGVVDAGALARLPEGTLAHRFGPEGVAAARLARGEDGAPLVGYVPATLPHEALELEAAAESAEPVLFALKRLADRVAARLGGRGLGATRLKLVLKLDPRGEERVVVPLAQPTAIAARWLVPLKEHLFSLRLPGAVTALRLIATEVAPVAIEQLAFGDRPEALAALEGVLARLAVRLGDGALFAAEPVERYRPESAYRPVPFRPGPARAGGQSRASGRVASTSEPRRAAGAPPGEAPRDGPDGAVGLKGASPLPEDGVPGGTRPTRLLAAPEAVVAQGEGGRLTALHVGGRDRRVLSFEGPERLSGEWWSGAFDRDYYRIRLDGLGDCWVFRDGADGRLYLHGFFD